MAVNFSLASKSGNARENELEGRTNPGDANHPRFHARGAAFRKLVLILAVAVCVQQLFYNNARARSRFVCGSQEDENAALRYGDPAARQRSDAAEAQEQKDEDQNAAATRPQENERDSVVTPPQKEEDQNAAAARPQEENQNATSAPQNEDQDAASAPQKEEGQDATSDRQKEENQRAPAATHYDRTLGPFSIDGHNFTVKLSVNCYKESAHPGMCNEDDQEAVKSMRILDENGKTRFSDSYPIGYLHQLERHTIDVTLLEGHDHQALEIIDTRLPSHANTGVTIQLFGLHDGALQPMDPDPLHFYGQPGELPPGREKGSRALLAGDVLPIYVLTNYFYVLCPVRVDWEKFELDQQDSGEFEVVHQLPYGRKPDIQAAGFIHLYPKPDENSDPTGVDVTPQSQVEVLKALYRKGPPNKHDQPSDTWLQISIDGKQGWILGLDDYTAIGLSPVQ